MNAPKNDWLRTKEEQAQTAVSSYTKTQENLIALACLTLLPLIYLVGSWMMSM